MGVMKQLMGFLKGQGVCKIAVTLIVTDHFSWIVPSVKRIKNRNIALTLGKFSLWSVCRVTHVFLAWWWYVQRIVFMLLLVVFCYVSRFIHLVLFSSLVMGEIYLSASAFFFAGKDMRIIVFGFRPRTRQVGYLNNISFILFYLYLSCA